MAAKLAQMSGDLLKIAKPKVATFMYYAKVELRPPTVSEIPEFTKGVGRLLTSYRQGAWKNLTVKEGFLNFLVATEVVCWFFVGECIGRRHLIGYKFD